jgi:hypothetical protein
VIIFIHDIFLFVSEVINACRIFDIPGYADALGICTIFPSRTSKECFSLKK